METWQQQLAYYLAPGPTPSFPTIARVLLDRLQEQWRLWISCGDAKRPKINPANEVEQQLSQIEKVERWIEDDCPNLTSKEAPRSASSSPLSSSPSIYYSVGGLEDTKRHCGPCPVPFDLEQLRGGKWPKALAHIARTGLPADDSIGLIAYEMAKWLWWVELYDLPDVEREARIVGLLRRFVQDKHNGHITRWAEGRYEDVCCQITRCVKRAIALNEPQSMELMANLRREAGGRPIQAANPTGSIVGVGR